MDSKERTYWSFPIVAGLFDMVTTYWGLQYPELKETNPFVNNLELGEMMIALVLFKLAVIGIGILFYSFVLEEPKKWNYRLFVPVLIAFVWMVAGFINSFHILNLM